MSFDLPGRPPERPSDTFRAVRVVGTVTDSGGGSGSGCVELIDDNGVAWSLVGVVEPLSVGDRVEAVGMPMPEGYGGCVGAPVRVTRVVRTDAPG